MGLFADALKAQAESEKKLRHQILITSGVSAVINDPRCFHNDPKDNAYAFTEELNHWVRNLDEEERKVYNRYEEEYLWEFMDTTEGPINDEDWEVIQSVVHYTPREIKW